MTDSNDIKFDFGENWDNFSSSALTNDSVINAQQDFIRLCEDIEIENKTFLDIGFGQGLSLLTANSLKANCTGCDINPKCKTVLIKNAKYFNTKDINKINIIVGSILNNSVLSELFNINQNGKGFDIVHSWGVLHHTGDMWKAIENAASLVNENGKFIIAIYNKHWSSAIWKFIKWFYWKMPKFIKKLMVWIFYPIIWITKLIVTGKNPSSKQRGMNFYYDIIDWVGGYPYEYASKNEIIDFVEKFGFKATKTIDAEVPTGCNEFIFKKNNNG